MAGDRARRARTGGRADRLGQDACGVPVGDRPAGTSRCRSERRARAGSLYISPLKALGVDVERNLRAPLVGHRHDRGMAGHRGSRHLGRGPLRRHPAGERRRLVAHPPDILITTPESLFLMLTSAARETLRGVETVIVDEIHARRGHQARRPPRAVARAARRADGATGAAHRAVGDRAPARGGRAVPGRRPPVSIVAAAVAARQFDLRVVVPVDDLTDLGPADRRSTGGRTRRRPPQRRRSGHMSRSAIVDLVEQHRSTIVFANSRRLAERLTARLNEIGPSARQPAEVPPASSPATRPTAAGPGVAGRVRRVGVTAEPAVLARAHHGSVRKEQRALDRGRAQGGPAAAASSRPSQPRARHRHGRGRPRHAGRAAAIGRQRAAAHRPGRAPGRCRSRTGVHLPEAPCRPAARGGRRRAHARRARSSRCAYPRNPLDVLAQQIVAAVAVDEWDVEALFELVRRAAPFARCRGRAFDAVLDMLAGRYPVRRVRRAARPARVGPRSPARSPAGRGATARGDQWRHDPRPGAVRRVHGRRGRPGPPGGRARRGDGLRVAGRRRVHARLDVLADPGHHPRPGAGRAGTRPAGSAAVLEGRRAGRPAELGAAIGGFIRELAERDEADALGAQLADVGLDPWAAGNLVAYLAEQRARPGSCPTTTNLVVERFRDELGDWRIVLHSPYGRRGARAVGARARRTAARAVRRRRPGHARATTASCCASPTPETEPPGRRARSRSSPTSSSDSSPTRSAVRRCSPPDSASAPPARCSCRAATPASGHPLWQQRQRSAQLLEVAREYGSFPIILEAMRECLQDVYDLPALWSS